VRRWTHRLDRSGCCTRAGPIILAADHVRMFQAVFAWSAVPMDGSAMGSPGCRRGTRRFRRALRSLIVDGAIAGVGAVITFLPQILILFFFILLLEGDGLHGPRRIPDGPADARRRPFGTGLHSAALELRLRRAGDHGDAHDRRSQGPADDDPRRAADDLLGAAPVYTLIIAAFIPEHAPGVGHRPPGAGHVRPLRAAWRRAAAALALRRGVLKGGGGGFMMELPKYQWPLLKDVAIGLLTRVEIFLKRAGRSFSERRSSFGRLPAVPQAGPGKSRAKCRSRADRRRIEAW
jgi:ferrous iron transport protein B